jgi:farnesyl-diphosphate farnesyltransferase
MSDGMSEFSNMDTSAGLPTLKDMDKYCYMVAGVVGEMLTDLFCLQLPDELGPKREEMMKLAPSFGQALQMTNILKDVWVDKSRGACWLPRDVFASYGFDLAELENGQSPEEFQKGMLHLISIAYTHLTKAFEYTLMIPERESGMRKFCLWALLMSVLTIQKIRKNISDTESTNWKISRPSVKRVMVTTDLTVKQNRLLKLFFTSVSRGLSAQPTEFKA